MPVHQSRSGLALPSLAAAVLLGGLLVGGCSGPDRQTAKTAVVSLPPATATATGSPGSSASGNGKSVSPDDSADASPGVQLRLDDTTEKRQQIRKIYASCLAENGMGPNGQVSDTVRTKAEAACKDKAPIQPPELDPARNPHYNQDVVAEVKCLSGHGIPAVIVPATAGTPMSWTLTTADVPDDYPQINTACLVASFGSAS
ncbi:hypothetical protein ACIQPR_06860 [Streptomyces sp. NPDC091280]|uniref:hypothetical protein n=1 Tax=Streptomyces sp. NPDC091280 TaxID=3365984 RepID=UPI00380460A6